MDLPQNVLDEMNIVADLQDNFKELTEDNYSTILKSILESPFFSDNDFLLKISRYHQFWENVHVCLRERPKSFFLFIRIAADIFHQLGQRELVNPFLNDTKGQFDGQKYDQITSPMIILAAQGQKECQKVPLKTDGELFSHVYLEIAKNRTEQFYVFIEEPQILMFTYHLFKNGLFDKEKLYSFLIQLKDDHLIFYPSMYAFYRIFAPEVDEKEKEDPDFFDHILDNPKFLMGFPDTRKFEEHIDEYKANNWEKLIKFREELDFGNIVLRCLINDDVDLFKEKVSSHPHFDPDMRLEIPLFAPFDYLNQKPSIIGASAFFGSVNLFKYLMMLGASLHLLDLNGHTVVQFAAAGGSIEIIRLIEQEQQNVKSNPSAHQAVSREEISFEGALQVSSGFSRYAIFEWLLETQNYSISSVDKKRANVTGQASLENNPRLLQRCVEEGVNLNCLDSRDRFPIMKAITYRGYDVFRMMMFLPNIDLSVRFNSYSLVTLAVENDEDWIAKILLDDKRVILQDKDQSDILREMTKHDSMKCFRNVLSKHPKINFLTGMNYNQNALKNHFLFYLNSSDVFDFLYQLKPSFFSENLSYYEIVSSQNSNLLKFMISHKVGDINLNNGKALFAQILKDNEKNLLILLSSDLLDLNVKYKDLNPYQFAKKVNKPNMYRLIIQEMKKRKLINQDADESFEIDEEEEEEGKEESQ